MVQTSGHLHGTVEVLGDVMQKAIRYLVAALIFAALGCGERRYGNAGDGVDRQCSAFDQKASIALAQEGVAAGEKESELCVTAHAW